MKAVMYHYVRPDSQTPPEYYYLDLVDFRLQLDFFQREFGFISRDEFLSVIAGEEPVPEKKVLLTFDDGLADHYRWVYPELCKRDLWGIFYVPTGPYKTNVALDVHRIHSLLGTNSSTVILSALEELVTEEMIPDKKKKEFSEYTYQTQINDKHTTKVKRILNYFIDYEYRTAVLDELINQFPNAKLDTSSFYLSPSQLAEMASGNMLIGSHSVTHRVFSKLNKKTQRKEITESFECLEEMVDEPLIRNFCYPYGGSYTFTDTTIDLLKSANCKFSFDVKSRDISQNDISERLHTLPRYDCNEFPHGEASGGT